MARSFAAADPTYVRFAAGPLESQTWGAMTIAGVCLSGYDGGGAWRGIFEAAQSGGTMMDFQVSNNSVTCYSPNFGEKSGEPISVLIADRWNLLVMTKPAGDSLVRFHKFQWSTGTWTHLATASGTGGNPDPVGAGGWYQAGSVLDQRFKGDIAAVAKWSREMTDSEVERLNRGRWDMTGPDFLTEFPAGGDDPTHTKDRGRYRLAQSVMAGTVRSVVADPPGFCFSPGNRRR